MVRTQVHAEDHETILEFEDVDSDDEKEKENTDDFFDIEEKGDDDEKVVENGVASFNGSLIGTVLPALFHLVSGTPPHPHP